MPYFKTPDNALHFLSEEDIANGGMDLLPAGCIEITSAEAEALRSVMAASTTTAPRAVTPVQAFTALDQAGHLAPLLAYLDAPDTPPLVRAVALGATDWRRDSLLLMTVAIVLGLTASDVDDLFDMAARIDV